MRVRDLGSRPAPASVREYFSRITRGRGPATPVERRQIAYWEERGWKQQGRTFSGSYQTPYGAFEGWIEQRLGGHIDFFLRGPSSEITNHSHWTCFQDRGQG